MDAPTIISVSVSVLVALTGSIGTYIALRQQKAEQEDQEETRLAREQAYIQETYHKLLDPLQERVEKLELALAEKDAQIEELMEGVRILIAQLQEKGIPPKWTLDGRKPKRKERFSLRPPRNL